MSLKNIITLSDQGLFLDTLSKGSKHFPAYKVVRKQNILLFSDESSVCMYDLISDKLLKSYSIKETKDLNLSNCATYGAAIAFNGTLFLFNKSEIIKQVENIKKFTISSNYLIYSAMSNLQIFDLKERINVECNIKTNKYFIAGTNIIYKTGKNENNDIKLVFENLNDKKCKQVYQFPQILDFEIRSNKDASYILILITTEHAFDSYYFKPSLFLLNCKDGVLKEMKQLENILFCDFVGDDIVVCFGHQPSDVFIFDIKMNIKRKFPKGIRNKIYFNPQGNLVCFAGFDNLSGTIEIYSNNLLTKIKVLGASEVVWSPCGSYFIVAITEKLKVNNKIIVYDYYGRLIKESSFERLVSCSWYGVEQEFKEIERPSVLNIPEESAYIPPHLRNKKNQEVPEMRLNKQKHMKNVEPKKINNVAKLKTKPIPKKINISDLKKELEEISALKVRISKGEFVGMDNLNKILKEEEIIKSIEMLNEK